MTESDEDIAWKTFWARQMTASTAGIVSQEWSAISYAQFEAWKTLAQRLPQSAKILDIASGNGKLLEMLLAMRPDVEALGIDIATHLPPAPNGVELIGGVRMENLPFDSSTFDAVVSQFGFEYGDSVKVADEVIRVVRNQGAIGLMIHRGDGPILAHNTMRKQQIEWVRKEKGLFENVTKLMPPSGTSAPEAVAFAEKIAALGAQSFGPMSAAWEIPEAVRRTLLLGPRGSRQKLLETLQLIEQQAENEIGRIASLEKACCRADDRETLLAAFRKHGRSPKHTAEVKDPEGRAFADLIIL